MDVSTIDPGIDLHKCHKRDNLTHLGDVLRTNSEDTFAR